MQQYSYVIFVCEKCVFHIFINIFNTFVNIVGGVIGLLCVVLCSPICFFSDFLDTSLLLA